MEGTTKQNDARKRKIHTKSRKGCKNCKLRRVKCDEGKPQCEKCISYGVTCDYDGDGCDELQLPGEGAFRFISQPLENAPTNKREYLLPKDSMSPDDKDDKIEGMLNVPISLHETGELYYISKEDVEILYHFRDSTVFTIGTAQTVPLYRAEIVNMVCSKYSYLTHIVLTLTLMHMRYKNSPNPWTATPTEKESFHWYHGTAQFRELLSYGVKDEDRDPLWGAAALVGCCTLGSIEATKAEEAWPMKAPGPEDLDWLRMSDGKKEVWKIVDPLRENSVWRDALNYNAHADPEPYGHRVPELDLLYPFLIKIYDFDPESSEHAKDPYHTAASILTRLLELDCNHSTIMYFLSFMGHMDIRFRQLLHAKDPKALLLLAWYFGKMCQYHVWWSNRRMMLEGQAICMYLETYHSDNEEIMRLLSYPKMMTGLIRD